MEKAYLGVDIGSISTKGLVIDKNNNIIASSYLYTEGNQITATKKVIKELKNKLDLTRYKVVGVGTTGSARKLIGTILGANIVKNEITAHAIGTTSIYPNVHTIFEIGGQDSKIIMVDNGIVTDYAMNTLCATGIGSFLSKEAKKLNISIEEFGSIALSSNNPIKITLPCIAFNESNLIDKLLLRHKKEDILMGLCNTIANNYLNSLCKDKKIKTPIVFQGGVSKNIGVVKAFEKITGYNVIVDNNSHLMGALGVAILSKEKEEVNFSFDIENIKYNITGINCHNCSNNCEIIRVMENNIILKTWGNKCFAGHSLKKAPN